MSEVTEGGIKMIRYETKTDHLTMDLTTGLGSGTREHTLAVHNISYSVSIKTRACCGRKTTKTILKNVNATFKPGMNAVLGPTGSGKSSLLDVLAGRKEPGGLTGDLLIDGAPPPDNFKCMVGYVVQDDVVMGTLTVRENFQFSAALRLPSSTPRAERERRVDSVIEELGLTKCADTKVGNAFIRGVSGGERKRTNIGMELIISPPVLFLDEPTTGLDASTANSVMYALRRLALKGRTIVFSIHQPRYSIYKVFDNLTLLSEGEIIYQGPAPGAVGYFKSIGYICEEHNNPPDFFLDVIKGDYDTIDNTDSHSRKTNDNKQSLHKRLVEKFAVSECYENVLKEIVPIHDNSKRNLETGDLARLQKVDYATSFLTQLCLLSGRATKNVWRNPQTSIMQTIVTISYAVIVGTIYFQLDKSASTGIQNRVGAFFIMVTNQLFGKMSALDLFIKERSIFMHENVSGFYRVSAYFLAKVFCDVIVMTLYPAIAYSAIVYWMLGLRNGVDHFFFFVLNLFLTTLAASCLAFAVSASVRIFSIANLLVGLPLVFMMLFGGLLVNVASILDWLEWLKWLSIFRYSVVALYINELKGQEFCDDTSDGPANCTTGDDYLSSQGISFETTLDLWVTQIALAGFSFLFLTIAYIQLRRLKKIK